MSFARFCAVAATLLSFSCVPVVAARAQSQAEMNREAATGYAKADREMNLVYRRALAEYRSDAAFVAKLRTAQRAWLVYRDAHVAALYPAKDPLRAYGSVYPFCLARALTEATKSRTDELRRWLDGVGEGDVCAGSVRIRGGAAAAGRERPCRTASVGRR